MRSDDLIGLVVVLVIAVVVLAVYIGLIVLGVTMAKRKNRSPHWMWFAIHPVGLLITLIVMACLSPLKRCPQCAQTTSMNARLCGICGYSFMAPGVYAPQPPVYIPPQRY
jgi:ABC-type multidrug transport system permease subunit